MAQDSNKMERGEGGVDDVRGRLRGGGKAGESFAPGTVLHTDERHADGKVLGAEHAPGPREGLHFRRERHRVRDGQARGRTPDKEGGGWASDRGSDRQSPLERAQGRHRLRRDGRRSQHDDRVPKAAAHEAEEI